MGRNGRKRDDGEKVRADLVVDERVFDYSPLATSVADDVRGTAERIRQKLKKAMEDIVDVGNDMLAVKTALRHGPFGFWLRAIRALAAGRIRLVRAGDAERHPGRRVVRRQIRYRCGFGHPAPRSLFASGPSIQDEALGRAIRRAEPGDRSPRPSPRKSAAT